MSQPLHYLNKQSLAFPTLDYALTEPNGLLAAGGDLSSARIVEAYRSGIFPWYSEQEPILWWSPSPRAIIFTDQIRINRTLRKTIQKQPYKISVNKAFEQVISYCAKAPFRSENTWILPEMKLAYIELHKQGYAHSIEVWDKETLVGGLYGIAINGFFSGESMFYIKSNASKLALVALVDLLKERGIDFIDCQILNPFLQDMGAEEINRNAFVELKDVALGLSIERCFWRARYL